jgi:hypothetical protein
MNGNRPKGPIRHINQKNLTPLLVIVTQFWDWGGIYPHLGVAYHRPSLSF